MKHLKKVVRSVLMVLLLPMVAMIGMVQWAFDDKEENAWAFWWKSL